MATREENLKKINEKLEKLSDEELDQIVGGFWIPTRGNLAAIDAINQENHDKVQITNIYNAPRR